VKNLMLRMCLFVECVALLQDFTSQNDLAVNANFVLNLGKLRKQIVIKSIEQTNLDKLNLLLGSCYIVNNKRY